jgi:hypothetical protein
MCNAHHLKWINQPNCYIHYLTRFILFYFLRYWGLNSWHAPSATLPAIFLCANDFLGFFEIGSHKLFADLALHSNPPDLCLPLEQLGLQVWATGAMAYKIYFLSESFLLVCGDKISLHSLTLRLPLPQDLWS